MKSTVVLALTLAAFSCKENPTATPVHHATIGNPMVYLVEDAENAGRHDWPLPVGYVALANVAEGNGTARQTWDFAPFGSYEPERGDGFQVAEVGSDGWVRFTSTRDGGKPFVQHFVGQRCKGTGWLVFGSDATTGTWREVVATLSIAHDPATCPPSLDPAFTRYRREQVEYPFSVTGRPSTRIISTVISEHYDRESIDSSSALERSYLGKGYGLLRWEAWRKTPPPIGDLPERCRAVAYSEPPAPGWQLNDCRTYTVLP